MNSNHRLDGLDRAGVRTSAVAMYTECVGTLSYTHNTVILVMNMEPHENALQRMDLVRVKCICYRKLLKQAISANPNITPVEETDKYNHSHDHINI
jgi:hypothetical protein